MNSLSFSPIIARYLPVTKESGDYNSRENVGNQSLSDWLKNFEAFFFGDTLSTLGALSDPTGN